MNEVNTDDFLKLIQHATDRNNNVEMSECRAIEIDGQDGLACYLGFKDGEISKVDYCVFNENDVQFIELSDLRSNIQEILKVQRQGGARSRQEIKACWTPLVQEFKLKYQGSLSVIERLYRRSGINCDNPVCQLLIVCKNETDIIMLDLLRSNLSNRLQGMIRGGVNVCNTRSVCQELISE